MLADPFDELDPHAALGDAHQFEDLDDEHVVGDAELTDRRQKAFSGRRSRSIMTTGDAAHVDLVIDGEPIPFDEAEADMVGSGATFDEAIAIGLNARGAVIVGDPLSAEPFIVWGWPEAEEAIAPPALNMEASADVAAIVVGGCPLFRADPSEPMLRWVTVPGLADYYGLSADLKQWVRDPMEAAWRRADGAGLPDFDMDITEVPFPTLRLLIASNPAVVPVKKVVRSKKDRGAVVYGVTRPYLTRDLNEPEIYLPVISMKEGNVDAINAWDLDAGISLGPVQYNVISGHLFHTLLKVQREDPDLFAATFAGLGWTATEIDGRPALRVATDDGEVTLMSKRGEDRDGIRYNAGYFQAGVAGRWGLSKIDGDFRRDLAARFRNLVLWPHVQRWLMAQSGRYLAGGSKRMVRAEVPAVDPADLDRDAFTLRALLMSGYVRYGASLKLTLKHLSGLGSASPGELLENMPRALDQVAKTNDNWPDRVDRLKARYFGKAGKAGQVDHAHTVLSMRS